MFPDKCANQTEIDNWFSKQLFFAVTQKNIVNTELDQYTSDDHFATDEGYFPIEKIFQPLYY